MTREVPIPNPPLSAEEASAVSRLSSEQLIAIDNAILSCSAPHWQKVARMVTLIEKKLASEFPQLTYVFYANRIRVLAGQGRLESQGDLSFMRFSEVKLPNEN